MRKRDCCSFMCANYTMFRKNCGRSLTLPPSDLQPLTFHTVWRKINLIPGYIYRNSNLHMTPAANMTANYYSNDNSSELYIIAESCEFLIIYMTKHVKQSRHFCFCGWSHICTSVSHPFFSGSSLGTVVVIINTVPGLLFNSILFVLCF